MLDVRVPHDALGAWFFLSRGDVVRTGSRERLVQLSVVEQWSDVVRAVLAAHRGVGKPAGVAGLSQQPAPAWMLRRLGYLLGRER